MGRAVIALVLILDVLVCPFACSGSMSLGSGIPADPCCSPKQTDPGDESPRPPVDGCDGSCGSCLCGGAINAEESGADCVLAQVTPNQVWLPVLNVGVAPPRAPGSQLSPFHDTPVFPSGVALRALLQSFLL